MSNVKKPPLLSDFFSKLFAFKKKERGRDDGKLTIETQEVDRVWVEFLDSIYQTFRNVSNEDDVLIINSDVSIIGKLSVTEDAELPNLRYNAKLYYYAHF